MVSATNNTKKEKSGTGGEGDEFVYLVSHQLRNPITRIKWTIELLLQDKKLKGQTREYLTLIRTSAVCLNDLITVLLNVSRIERGKMFFSPRSFDLVEFVKNFLNEYAPFFADKNISVIFEKHPPVLNVMIDSAAFYNIIQSLISNAIEYTPKGGKVKVFLEKKDSHFLFTVNDTGVGIPKEEQAAIFKKFSRGSNAQIINREGLGLGLYAASQTVKLLNGKIWLESPAPGAKRGKQGKQGSKGTTFYVELALKYAK